MKPDPTPSPRGPLLDEMRQALRSLRGKDGIQILEDAGTGGKLFPPPGPSRDKSPAWRAFVLAAGTEQIEPRVSGQFDLAADGWVRDDELGTLGILQLLPPSGEAAAAEKLRGWIRTRIDEATYLRHLLLEAARDGDKNLQAYTVELVLVAREAQDAAIPHMGAVLRELMRETTFLHAVGVNLWKAPLADSANLRRAFAWLLVHARRWLEDETAALAPNARLRALSVQDFRLAGNRKLSLQPEHVLHVIHGHNGSGKTSLVEALEIAVTGKLDRIETEGLDEKGRPRYAKRYREVLTNRDAPRGSSARVRLWRERQPKPDELAVVDEGIDSPLKAGFRAGSFRMDQRLADRLALRSGATWATTFFEAFFPEREADLADWKRARAALDKSFARLPKEEQKAIHSGDGPVAASDVLQKFGWLGGSEIDWAKIRTLVPVSGERLAPLAPLLTGNVLDQLRESTILSWERTQERAAELDKTIGELHERAPEVTGVLQRAAALLREFGPRSVGEQARSDRALPELMNEWLELAALTDLMEKENAVLSTIEAARNAGYEFAPDCGLALLAAQAPISSEQHTKNLKTLREKRDATEGFLRPDDRQKHVPGSVTPALSGFDPAALDEAAQLGFLGEDFKKCKPALSSAVRAAFEKTGEETIVRSGERELLPVGKPSWGMDLLALVNRALEGFAAIRPPNASATAMPLSDLLSMLRGTIEDAKALQQTNESLVDDFTRLLSDGGPFSLAINELLALLTPARWAYQDLATQPSLKRAEQQVEFTADGVPAWLRLNTAELNAFALAQFLLGARRTANPLRLIVLDDCLQNMDELTVTTVGRGLGKMLRLWRLVEETRRLPTTGTQSSPQAAWQVLLLLHGEENVERLRQEIPCAVYFLPWLTPREPESTLEINASLPWMRDELQALPLVIQET